jgi:membrane-associated phospholipid phosphatase
MTIRREKLVVSVLLQLLVAGGFVAVERMTRNSAVPAPSWLVTPLDSAIPVVAETVWLYVSWYPAPLLLLCLERHHFRRGATAVLLAFLFCVVGFIALPVSIDRPAIGSSDGLSPRALQALYALDPPVNLFPSFHAAVAAVMAAARSWFTRLQGPLALWMSAICLSCVTTKQHYVLDVVAGIVVGLVAYRLALLTLASFENLRSGGALRPVPPGS